MHDAFTLAIVVPIPFAIIEWFAIASYVVYWYPRPSSLWRALAGLLAVACAFGFFPLQLSLLPTLIGYDPIAGRVFLGEAVATMVISVVILFSLAYRQQRLRERQGKTMPEDSLPASYLPKALLVVIGFLAALLTLVTMLPREFVAENQLTIKIAIGLVAGVVLAPLLKKKK
jgi:hypothetical protein